MTSTQRTKPVTEIRCPYEKSIHILGDKYALLILRDIYLKNTPLRFNELLHNLRPMSSKTLSAKLKDLTGHDILKKTIVSTTPIVVTYEFTEKGRDLTSLLDRMADWSRKWYN
ncbi:MAG: helix-turn-helix domain-containing protein [Methanomicrobiales archaeon]|nr:helix-turn-helix domain-containing protein [Methanoregula sp.]